MWSSVASLASLFVWKWKCSSLFVTPWTVAHQAPLSMEFAREVDYRSGLPCPSPGDLPDPRIKPGFPALKADSLLSEPPQGLCTFCWLCPEAPPLTLLSTVLSFHTGITLNVTTSKMSCLATLHNPSPHSKFPITIPFWQFLALPQLVCTYIYHTHISTFVCLIA